MHRKDLDIRNRGHHTGDHGMLNLEGGTCDHGMRLLEDDTCDHGNVSKDAIGGDASVR